MLLVRQAPYRFQAIMATPRRREQESVFTRPPNMRERDLLAGIMVSTEPLFSRCG